MQTVIEIVEDYFDIYGDSINVVIMLNTTAVATYDGKNSIDEIYNDRQVNISCFKDNTLYLSI